jgi:hypothetical protein
MYTFEPRNRILVHDPQRFFFQNPDLIFFAAGLKPGQRADIGCGTDFLPLSRANRGRENSPLNAVDTFSTMIKKEGLR